MYQTVLPRSRNAATICSDSVTGTRGSFCPCTTNSGIEILSTLIVATYADRFDSFSGQRFVTDAVQPARSGVVVQTRLVRSNGESVTLDYFMRDGKVFNVVVFVK